MATIIAYIITLVCVFFAITPFLPSLAAGIFGRVAGMGVGMTVGAFTGAILTWLLINFLWMRFEGQQLPVLAMALSFGILSIHGSMSAKELNQNAKTLMVAEMWGIIAVGIFIIAKFGLRWY